MNQLCLNEFMFHMKMISFSMLGLNLDAGMLGDS